MLLARVVDVGALLAFAERQGFSGPEVESLVDAYLMRIGGRRSRAIIPGRRVLNRIKRFRHQPPVAPICSWVVPVPAAQEAGWSVPGVSGSRAANRQAMRRLAEKRLDPDG
jgi:hypothetical protein